MGKKGKNRREFLKITTLSGVGIGLSGKIGNLFPGNPISNKRNGKESNEQVKLKDDNFSIGNEVILKKIAFFQKKPGAITVYSLIDKANKQELLASRNRNPWFEFVINHQLVTSDDPVWQFLNLSKREIRNKGTEYTLHFEGASFPVKGLVLSIKEQLFPQSTVIREQLILYAKDGSKFELNKLDNKQHFIFPQYTYKKGMDQVESKEIRIATWDGEILDELNHSSFDTRFLDYRLNYGGDHNLSQNHMFHPKIIMRQLKQRDHISFKGPLGFISDQNYTFLTAYEHASQDNMFQDGAREYADFSEKKLDFLHINYNIEPGKMSSAVKIIRGGYLEGEKISTSKPYESVWTVTGFSPNKEPGHREQLLHDYLLKWITEFPRTRETKFYYNTWALQVNTRKNDGDSMDIMQYHRIIGEIEYAHQLGVEIFTLDAGWEEMSGVWKPSLNRLPKGLGPIYEELEKYNMTLGLWMAPLDVSSEAERFKQHPEWIIENEDIPKDRHGSLHFFDFVSGYADLFIEDCKKLIDQGVRYFKWDDIGTYYSSCTKGDHGADHDLKEDVKARYGYLLPLYIKRAMVELMNYNPDVVIEIDLTENARALMGLATISAGKLFFMNNGASDYGDYSQYRAKSTRTIVNVYNEIIPRQLFTYANYPFNSLPFMAQRYNVNSSIICGGGFSGDLSLMNSEQRDRVGILIKKVRRIRPLINNIKTVMTGIIGASPEIYTTVNPLEAAGMVIAFSGRAIKNNVHQVQLNKTRFFGVLNNAFAIESDTLQLYFQFPAPDSSREAIILPNQDSGIHVISCTSWLEELSLEDRVLKVVCGAPCKIKIIWPKSKGFPELNGAELINSYIDKVGNNHLIEISVPNNKMTFFIEGNLSN
ncbi:MAG: hypothetical protein EPN37_08235 [Chitinophagaceae bacterium]|nr:MAG: hypothetical protein EPN37_08235 [Chitinophagaceae bacterium]